MTIFIFQNNHVFINFIMARLPASSIHDSVTLGTGAMHFRRCHFKVQSAKEGTIRVVRTRPCAHYTHCKEEEEVQETFSDLS